MLRFSLLGLIPLKPGSKRVICCASRENLEELIDHTTVELYSTRAQKAELEERLDVAIMLNSSVGPSTSRQCPSDATPGFPSCSHRTVSAGLHRSVLHSNPRLCRHENATRKRYAQTICDHDERLLRQVHSVDKKGVGIVDVC